MGALIRASNLENQISQFWSKFRAYEESECIGSNAALRAIYGLALLNAPKNILEFGTGIGTITAFLLSATSADILTVEKDAHFYKLAEEKITEYCALNEIDLARVKLVDGISIANLEEFDWLLIDGSVNSLEWKMLFRAKNLQIVIIENQRFTSRLRVLGMMLHNNLRFQYSEIDTESETGIAAFHINRRGRRSYLLNFLDCLAVLLLLMPRFVRMTVATRGRNLLINKS
jgi:phospholipid N-methyltransferase